MKKRTRTILCLAALSAMCIGLAACSSDTPIDEYRKKGYVVSVAYDPNGGNFLNRDGITFMDMFKPSDYEADENGTVKIKLVEPTSTIRPSGSQDSVSLTLSGHFFAGWYSSREILKDTDGNVLDEYGVQLTEKDGKYIYADTGLSAIPGYVYDGYWDFENDVISYTKGDDPISMTLYAGWVPYYEFDYYCKKEGNWEKFATTTFDYKTQQAHSSDKNKIWVPTWQDGIMTYTNNGYTFPKVEGTTFLKAYTDSEMSSESEIVESFTHQGTLDLETCKPTGRVQNIYVDVEQGERYKISNASKFVENINLSGIYEICEDLDFTNLTWPAAYTTGVFTGKIIGSNGVNHKLSNIKAAFSSTSAKNGGLFGTLSKDCEIKNVAFENVEFTLASTGGRLNDTSFGLFAGQIDEDATLSEVTISNATFKIRTITLGTGYKFNLLANGNCTGVTALDTIHLVIYGEELVGRFRYTIDSELVVVDNTSGNISLTFSSASIYKKEEYQTIQ